MCLEDYEELNYTPVHYKSPFLTKWQLNPLPFEISEFIGKYIPVDYGSRRVPVLCTGIGILLGDGVVAIDFDGPEAFEFFDERFGSISNYNVNMAWTSGKPSRMQVLWKVPEKYWHLLRTVKVGKGGKLEFRWKGSQSVIPPSLHSDEYGLYKWLAEPIGDPICEIPENILEWWLNYCSKLPEENNDISTDIVGTISDEGNYNKVKGLVEIIRGHMMLKSREEWSRICWAVAHEVGIESATSIMRTYFPEDRPGAYRNIFKSYKRGASPGFGTLYHWANLCNSDKTKEVIRRSFEAERQNEERALAEFFRKQKERIHQSKGNK